MFAKERKEEMRERERERERERMHAAVISYVAALG